MTLSAEDRATAAKGGASRDRHGLDRVPDWSIECLKYGQQYVDKRAEYYEQRNRQQQIEFVRKKAAQLSLQVTAAHV
jgi:hypothetical protein